MVSLQPQIRQGFSLVELVIYIAIVAVLAMVAIPAGFKYMKDARISSAKSKIRAFEGAITMFQVQMGQYPSQLKDLVEQPSDERLKRKWTGEFLEKKPDMFVDPWSNKYQYKLTPQDAEHKYELYSYGPNGKGSPKSEWISVWELE
jgi:type II secretion system protein G